MEPTNESTSPVKVPFTQVLFNYDTVLDALQQHYVKMVESGHTGEWTKQKLIRIGYMKERVKVEAALTNGMRWDDYRYNNPLRTANFFTHPRGPLVTDIPIQMEHTFVGKLTYNGATYFLTVDNIIGVPKKAVMLLLAASHSEPERSSKNMMEFIYMLTDHLTSVIEVLLQNHGTVSKWLATLQKRTEVLKVTFQCTEVALEIHPLFDLNDYS